MNQHFPIENKISPELPQYCTVHQIVSDRSFCFTESMLRYYILHAHKNGFKKVVRRIGRKVVLRRDLLISWLEEHSACQATPESDPPATLKSDPPPIFSLMTTAA